MSWWRRTGGARVTLRVVDARNPEPPPLPTGDEAFDELRAIVHESGYLRAPQNGRGADPVIRDAPTIIICRSPFRARLGLRYRR